MSVIDRRMALEYKLHDMRMTTPMPTAEAIARWNLNIKSLESELAALPPPPRKAIEMRTTDSFIAADTRNGSNFQRPEFFDDEPSDSDHDYDPMLREYGLDIK